MSVHITVPVQEHEVRELALKIRALGFTVPSSIVRTIELLDVARSIGSKPSGSILTLTDDEARTRLDAMATARAVDEYKTLRTFTEDLLDELRGVVVPELDALIASMRDGFDAAARPLVVAAQDFGIRFETTPEEMIERDAKAIAAYRAARAAWKAVAPFAAVRIAVAKTFRFSPTVEEAESVLARWGSLSQQQIGYSVLFAAGDGWSFDGTYSLMGRHGGALDWLKLAAGGLHLNTHDEVRAKIHTRGGVVSPVDDLDDDDNDDLDEF